MKIKIVFIATILLGLSVIACGQTRTNTLKRPCSGSSTPAKVWIKSTGDIDLVPCSGKTVLIDGAPIGPGGISGSGTTNHIPMFSSAAALADSPITYDSTNELLAIEDGDGDFALNFRTKAGIQSFSVQGLDASLNLSNLVGDGYAELTASSVTTIGDINGVNGLRFQVDSPNRKFSFASNVGGFDTMDFGQNTNKFLYSKTITPLATGGNVTINKPAGTVNVETGSTNVQVLNSTVDVNSLVFATKRSSDPACQIDYVAPAVGSFTVVMTAACSTNTSIGFFVVN